MRPAGRAVDFSDPAHRCNRFFQSIDQEAGDAVNDQFRHGAPIERNYGGAAGHGFHDRQAERLLEIDEVRSEEHTSELQSLMRISYAVFCLKKKKQSTKHSRI